MIDCPNMIIVGSAGRNVGKTEFCCKLIRRLSRTHSVTGIKITPTEETLGEPPYHISKESGALAHKDTSRMIEAGASQVFWLRTSRDKLAEALPELLEQIPAANCIICESASARAAVKPGTFLIIQSEASDPIKPSCRKLMHKADQIVTFYGDHWDFTPEQARFGNNRWHILNTGLPAETEEAEP